MSDLSYMDQNYEGIRARMDAAKARGGKSDVTLVAAIKYTDAEHVNYLHRVLGVNDVGEIACNSFWSVGMRSTRRVCACILSARCKAIR